MKKVKIFSLIMVPEAGQYLVTLEELDGTRLLPIWIGPPEGMAIAAVLGKNDFPRPLTHDLLNNILGKLEANLEKVVITDLKDNTFYALLHIKQNGKAVTMDSRPSDSIAIALRQNAPIYAEERVFEKCPVIHKPISKDEVIKFKKKISTLRPEDFFKGKSNG